MRQEFGLCASFVAPTPVLSQQPREIFAHFFGIIVESPYLCIVNQYKRHLSDKTNNKKFNN